MRASRLAAMYTTLPRQHVTAAKRLTSVCRIYATVCRNELQIPEHRRGLMAERRERADQAERHRDKQRAKCRSRRRARQPDEREIHHAR